MKQQETHFVVTQSFQAEDKKAQQEMLQQIIERYLNVKFTYAGSLQKG